MAAKPGDEVSAMPVGPKAAGVDTVLSFVSDGLDRQVSHLGFLVGGPGGGKSHAVAEFVQGFELLGPVDKETAHRTYRYLTPAGAVLHVVNDATIPPDERDPQGLVAEVEAAVAEGAALLVCVNRGVIIEEARAAADAHSLGAEVVRWLKRGPEEDEVDFLRYTEVAGVAAQAAFLDTCSLLEGRPEVAGCGPETQASPYRVALLTERWLGQSDRPPAQEVLASALTATADAWEPLGEYDPVVANFQSLSNPVLQTRLLTILRVAEVFQGSRLPYRELWGIFSRSLFGGLPSVFAVPDARAWVQERVQLLEGTPEELSGIAKQWRAAEELARVRTHSALFTQTRGEKGDPVVRFVQPVDPARDARPGHWSPQEGDSKDLGWNAPVQEAFSSHLEEWTPGNSGEDPGPLDLVVKYCRCAADTGPCQVLSAYVTPFDRAVDAAYMRFRRQSGNRAKDVTGATRTYARMLTRLYATAHGIPAFAPEAGEWLRARGKQQVAGRLEDGLMALLRPSAASRADSYLPLLASRMVPITDVYEPVLAVSVPHLELSLRCNGDDMELVVRPERGSETFPMPLDFSLVREATAAADGQSGVTERSLVTSARVERTRAALVRDRRDVVALGPDFDGPIFVGVWQ